VDNGAIHPIWPGNVTEIPPDNANMTRCLAGTSLSSVDMDACIPCLPGFYQPIAGQQNCISCSFFNDGNAYQNQSQMTSCQRCPSGTERRANTSGTQAADCQYVTFVCRSCTHRNNRHGTRRCKPGYWRHDELTGLICWQCPEGAKCPVCWPSSSEETSAPSSVPAAGRVRASCPGRGILGCI
jgi:hypothetical protein